MLTSFSLTVGIGSRAFGLSLCRRRRTRWFRRMSSSAILTDRLKLAAQIVVRAKLGRCSLRHGHCRILVRLEFILWLRCRILDRRLLWYWGLFRQRWWWCWCRLYWWYSFFSKLTLHLFPYVQRFLKSRTLQSFLQFIIIVLVAVHEHIRLYLLVLHWDILPLLWNILLSEKRECKFSTN